MSKACDLHSGVLHPYVYTADCLFINKEHGAQLMGGPRNATMPINVHLFLTVSYDPAQGAWGRAIFNCSLGGEFRQCTHNTSSLTPRCTPYCNNWPHSRDGPCYGRQVPECSSLGFGWTPLYTQIQYLTR
jgi:hypothetical protein